ncbi:hypothetical protein JOM56_013922 [Amanita muscaria]
MSLKSFILQSFFVLAFCTSSLFAQNPFNLEGVNGFTAYVGYLSYPHDIPPDFVVSEAKRVWGYLPQTGGPGMVSALWTGGRQIYFASSVKGSGDPGPAMGYPPVITNALHACKQERASLGDHIFGESCSELMVITKWYRMNHGNLPPTGKLIVAVDHNRQVRAPCSEVDAGPQHRVPFGCADILQKVGFRADEIVATDPASCQIGRRSFGGLTVRGCVPKKPTAKPLPPGKPAPKKPTVQTPPQGKPKPAPATKPNTPSKPAPPRMPAKPKAPSNRH